MTSTHLAICIRKFLVHFEFKVRINVVGRAKPLQKWLKIGQLMAIFSHKWLMLWPKNHIFINISWHGSCGPLLSSFEVLEVPKTDKSSIVWRHHSKTPVPLKKPRDGDNSTTYRLYASASVVLVDKDHSWIRLRRSRSVTWTAIASWCKAYYKRRKK